MNDSSGNLSFATGVNDTGRRLDRVIRKFLPEIALSSIYTALRKGEIKVNGKKAEPSRRIATGDTILVSRKLLGSARKAPSGPAGDIPAHYSTVRTHYPPLSRSILYENDHLLAISKPCGVLVHGPHSLEEDVRRYLEPKLPHALSFTPGPLHRIDRNTTGLVFFSKSITGAHTFSRLLRDGDIEKYYLGVVDGRISSTETWSDILKRNGNMKTIAAREESGAQQALTVCIPLAEGRKNTLCLFSIESGRTHQIRAQASIHGHPLSGDLKYGGAPFSSGYLLHSWGVRLSETDTVLGFSSLTAPIPSLWHRKLPSLFGKDPLEKISFYAILDSQNQQP